MTRLHRRSLLLGLPFLASACGLSERPYAEQRAWPITLTRPEALPPRRGGLVLEVRSLRAGAGLEARGLQAVQPDGSIRTSFYEQWAVPPAEGVEEALRRWLADSGLYAAVVAPGTRVSADLVLDGAVTALWTNLADMTAKARVAVTVVDARAASRRILLQDTASGTVGLAATVAPAAVRAQIAALAVVFGQIEDSLRRY